jgi:hypothetical protein
MIAAPRGVSFPSVWPKYPGVNCSRALPGGKRGSAPDRFFARRNAAQTCWPAFTSISAPVT